MEHEIIAIFCIVDDILKALGCKDDIQAKMSSSEILTTAIVASLYFGGNFRKALKFMSQFCSYTLSESRFNRRLRKLSQKLDNFFEVIVEIFKEIPVGFVEEYAVDSFPVKVCENIRANRCKIAPGRDFRGYIASKRVYFQGVKVHIVASNKGYVKEFLITPGSVSDVRGLYGLGLNLGEGEVLYADRGYTDYLAEDLIKECEGIRFMPMRRKNSRRFKVEEQDIVRISRRFIETIGSCINGLFPKKIHAVRLEGFILKVRLFLISFNLQRLLQVAS